MRTWFALLVLPILALSDQSVSYATAGWACAHQHPVVLHVVHGLFLGTAIGGTAAAWQLWRATALASDEPGVRRHFLAGVATASGALSALVIVALWIPAWIIAPCVN